MTSVGQSGPCVCTGMPVNITCSHGYRDVSCVATKMGIRVMCRCATSLPVRSIGTAASSATRSLVYSVVPLVVGGDEIHATAFGGAVSEDCRSALRAALRPDSSAILFLIRPDEMSAAKAEAESLGGQAVFVEIEAGTARQLADAINGELVDSGAGR